MWTCSRHIPFQFIHTFYLSLYYCTSPRYVTEETKHFAFHPSSGQELQPTYTRLLVQHEEWCLWHTSCSSIIMFSGSAHSLQPSLDDICSDIARLLFLGVCILYLCHFSKMTLAVLPFTVTWPVLFFYTQIPTFKFDVIVTVHHIYK